MNTLYIICGSPASGKSTYGEDLAKKTNAVFLDIDTCTEEVIKAALLSANHSPDDRDSPYFKENYREAIYKTLFSIAKENLSINNVVITGPFTKEIRISSWPEKLEQELKAKIEIHYLTCSLEERKKRLIARNNPRDLDKLKGWGKHVDYYQGEKAPVFEHVFVDTSSTSR